MKSLHPCAEKSRRNGVFSMGLVADHNNPAMINVKVSRGVHQYDVAVPSNSNFGHLKSVVAQEIGVTPEKLALIFEGEVKTDSENLQTAGVVNNSVVVLMENSPPSQETSEVVHEIGESSKGSAEVAEIRKEVDNFSQQVHSLQAAVDAGTHVDDKQFIVLSEMLMRQLLKLDGVEAEGEGRVQRRAEVRRIQSLLEALDVLKSKNSNISNNARRSNPTTTHEKRSLPTPKHTPEAKTETQKPFHPPLETTVHHGHESFNSAHPIDSSPSQVPCFPPHTYPRPTHQAVPQYVPSHFPQFPSYSVPHYDPSSHLPFYYPSVDPSPYAHMGVPQQYYYAPSPMPYYSAASPSPPLNPFMPTASSDSPELGYNSTPSSTKVTQNWEHFS